MSSTTYNKQRKRFLQTASIPALLATSVLGAVKHNNDIGDERNVTCSRNNGNGTEVIVDTGCTRDKPICVDPLGQPPTAAGGVKCVSCINYFESPLEPDWGCPADKPLCVVVTTEHEQEQEQQHKPTTTVRPGWNQAGDKCVPYPCHRNTQEELSTTKIIDDGCTQDQPMCVDALGNNPPHGQPGVQCVASGEEPTSDPQTNQMPVSFWGLDLRNDQKQEISAWGLVGSRKQQRATADHFNTKGLTACSTSSNAGQFSFCGGCPFSSGQTKTCGIATTTKNNNKLSW